MKILFLADDFPPQSFGGAGISTCDLALGMKKAGHEVFVVTTCREEAEAGQSDYQGLTVWKIASDYPARWRSYISLYNRPVIKKLEEILKKLKPDVVHVNNVHLYLSYHSIKLSKKYTKVVVFTARDAMTFSYGKLNTKRYLENFDCRLTWLDNLKQAKKSWNPFRNFIIRKYLGYADKLLAVSNALRIALEQNGIKNVEVMYTGSSVSERHVSNEDAEQFRAKHGLVGKKVVLFSGRISEAKGGKYVLETIDKISKEIPELVLLIAGKTDAYSEKMKDEARKMGIEDKLLFAGWIGRAEMKYIYASSDVVLVPSVCFDAFPRTVLSAMAAGKPVVGTPYGGARELILDGITGYVVNPLKTKEMAEKIVTLLKNPQQASKLGKAGQERVKSEFNLEDKVVQHIAIYEKLS